MAACRSCCNGCDEIGACRLTCVNAGFPDPLQIRGMKRPDTGMAFETQRRVTLPQMVGAALVVALHIGFVYALATGLTVHAVMQVPQELIAQVVDIPHATPQPPPVAPNLAQPSLPTVAAPQIKIEQADTSSTRSITAYVGVPTPANTTTSPSSVPWTPAVAIEKTHTVPPYPLSARRLAQEGTVRLNLTISEDGRVADAAVLVSSGTLALDDAALAWVKDHWRYKPATKDGRAVATTIRAAVIFDLKNA